MIHSVASFPLYSKMIQSHMCVLEVLVAQLCLTLQLYELYSLLGSYPWNSPGKTPGVDCYSLFQGIFPTQGSNLGLLHCRQVLYHLSHQGSLYMYTHSFFECSLPLWFIIGYWIQLPVLYSRTWLFIHSMYKSLHLLIPTSCSFPLPSPPDPLGNHQSALYIVILLLFHRWVRPCPVLDSTCKWHHMAFVFLFLTYLIYYDNL